VTIRYDPRDLAEVRVFYRNGFLCRAINQEHSDQTIALKDIQAARTMRRRALRGHINERIARVTDCLPQAAPEPLLPADENQLATACKPSLRIYFEDP
jgi:putative transposase